MKKIRVKIATTATYPEGMASTYRIHCYAKAILLEESEIEVISTMPKKAKSGRMWLYRGKYDHIPYRIIFNRGRFDNRWLNYLRAEFNSYLLLWYCLLKIRQYDLIWLYGMGVLPRLILLPLLHLAKKKVILEMNEYPYSTEGNKYTRIPKIRKLLKRVTLNWVLPQFDGVVVISKRLREIVNRYAPKVKVLKIPILVDHERVSKVEKKRDAPLNHPYIFHAGSLSEQKDGIRSVIKAYINAALSMKKMNIHLHFVITNNSSLIWDEIEDMLVKAGLRKYLVITGYLEEHDLQHWMHHSTVLLINKPPSFQNQYNFPTKLGDYLLSGRPVVAAAKGLELNCFLKDGENSFIVAPNDYRKMADKIIELTKQPKIANSMGKKGKDLAQSAFNFRAHKSDIVNFINMI